MVEGQGNTNHAGRQSSASVSGWQGCRGSAVWSYGCWYVLFVAVTSFEEVTKLPGMTARLLAVILYVPLFGSCWH